jgi:hypothetical protein
MFHRVFNWLGMCVYQSAPASKAYTLDDPTQFWKTLWHVSRPTELTEHIHVYDATEVRRIRWKSEGWYANGHGI